MPVQASFGTLYTQGVDRAGPRRYGPRGAREFMLRRGFFRCERMIPKKLVPDLIRDGNRFSGKIMRNQSLGA
jgi:hypothetical protein